MTLTQLFDLSLALRREKVALEYGGATFTFGDVDRRANRMAHLLRAKGFEVGDRLCLQLVNSVEMIDLYVACVRMGVIFVPINVLYREREVAHILRDAEPRAFVTPENLPEWIREAAGMPGERPSDCPVLTGDTAAGIIYTSGTTGTSKGAVLTHNNFAANALNLLSCWQITSDDRLLLALPLFHVHGLGNGIHCWLMSGCRVRLLERFEYQAAAREFGQFQPTLFFGVPTIYVRLLDLDETTARKIGSTMRLFVSGSAPLPAAVLEEFQSKYGHVILERYGMSETLMNLSNPYVGERRPGSVGFPLPGVSVRIVNGELHLKGPNVFAGYWRREEATRDAFLDGWFKTGDLVTLSDDGYFTLTGRRSDVIISGGFNIYPREIEEFLTQQTGVSEAAVTAAPDRVRGEVPVAFYVGEADPEELEKACRMAIASFKVPKRFCRVEQIPRNAMGKIQKHLLPK